MTHLRAERQELADLLVDLTPGEWDSPTSCGAWTVRDVVAHLVAWDSVLMHRSRLGWIGSLARYCLARLRSFGNVDETNRRLLARLSAVDSDELVAAMQHDPDGGRWLFDRLAPGAQLAEYVVHHEDIRAALGRPRAMPIDRLIVALDGITKVPGVEAKRLLREHRWVATDAPWAAGRGPVVEDEALRLLRRLAGRAIT